MAVKWYRLFISSTRILTARLGLTYRTPVMETGCLFKRPISFFHEHTAHLAAPGLPDVVTCMVLANGMWGKVIYAISRLMHKSFLHNSPFIPSPPPPTTK